MDWMMDQSNQNEGVHEMLRSLSLADIVRTTPALHVLNHTEELRKCENPELERDHVSHLLEDHEMTWKRNQSPGFIMTERGRTSSEVPSITGEIKAVLHTTQDKWTRSGVVRKNLDGVVLRASNNRADRGLEGTEMCQVMEVQRLQDRATSPLNRATSPLRWRSNCDGSMPLSLEELPVSTDWRVSHPLSISGGGHTIFS